MQPILHINVTTALYKTIDIPRQWGTEYLGGASLAARFLYQYLTPDLDPFSPEAPLLFLNGPLTGTSGPAVGRFVVCGRSPATRLWGESNCGGFWGPELRMAGYDGLLITGCSESPIYVSINDQEIEIRSAAHLWGLDTCTTQKSIVEELGIGKFRVAVIGPAGEALIPFAMILTDHGRVAGRTGMGAVMGSKRLKAIAVKGSGKVPSKNTDKYFSLRSEANKTLKQDAVSTMLRELGTAGVADYFDYLAEMPKLYYQEGVMQGASQISGSAIAETILVGVSACHACVIACGRVVDLGDGVRRKGPEYETLAGFGPNLGIKDPVVITRLGELCDRYGMDTISLSNTIGLAFSLFEKRLLSGADTDGLALNWGNDVVVEELIHKTVRCEGLGYWIARGARGLGRHFKAEDESVQVNGLEVAYHDPRGASGMSLVYATSPRGACHNQSDYFLVDIGQSEPLLGIERYSRQGGEEKAPNVALHQNWKTIFNSLVMCFFANVPPETLLSLVNAACDLDWTLEDLLQCGERGWTLKRVINNRFGLSRQNDRLPKALLRPYRDNPESANGYVPDFVNMLEAYYRFREWDLNTGYPTKRKLNELGLKWVIKDIWPDA